MTPLLAAKLVVAPSFVVGVTLVGRRLGPSAAGMLAALPVVGGPILGLIVVEQGSTFGAHAALAGAVGAATTMVFTLVYTNLARRLPAWACLVAAYAVFAALTVALQFVPVGLVAAIAIPLVTWTAVLAAFPVPDVELPRVAAPRWDLPVRALATLVLVLVITGVARALGPTLAGLITPAPIATAVLAVFTHRQAGSDAVAILLRSLTRGLGSFTSFFVACGLLLPRTGAPLAFAFAAAVALVVQAVVLRFGIARPRTPSPGA